MTDKDSIVFINQDAGYLMIDIINAHQNKYKQRSLITGKLIARNIKLDSEVEIRKVVRYDRSSSLKRLFTWCWGFVQILWLVKTRYRKADIFIVTNPPFAVFLPLLCKNKFSILVYDVYPDVLIAYNYFGNHSFIARIWRKANRTIFANAQQVFTISSGIKKVISEHVASDKINIVPIWTDNNFLKPLPKAQNIFIKQYQLENKFLVIYSGNLGYSHSVEALVEVAATIKDREVYFIIIGKGDKKQLLMDKIGQLKLTNCLMLPLQTVEMLPFSLSAADLAVVSLGKEASGLSIPSKTFSLMSVGAPLLCIAGIDSELAVLINDHQIGKCFGSTEIEQMVDFINLVKSNKDYHQTLQLNALKASKNFGPENAFKFVAS